MPDKICVCPSGVVNHPRGNCKQVQPHAHGVPHFGACPVRSFSGQAPTPTAPAAGVIMPHFATSLRRLMAMPLLLTAASQLQTGATQSTSPASRSISRSYSPHARQYSPHTSYPTSPPSEPPAAVGPPPETLTAVSPTGFAGEPGTSETSLEITPDVLYGPPAPPASALLQACHR